MCLNSIASRSHLKLRVYFRESSGGITENRAWSDYWDVDKSKARAYFVRSCYICVTVASELLYGLKEKITQ